MPVIETIFAFLPLIVAPFILFLFSLVSAYVLKFGMRMTGINADYVIFGVIVILCAVFGGVI